jgi:uncharacterized PurR-regulated membrane protein YhhQ (DUF165 family)
MSTLPNLLRSLLLTSIFSFLTPVFFLGMLLVGSIALSYLPHLSDIGTSSLEQIIHFLQVFGSNSAWRGIIVIGLVGSLVGSLFDTYIFYRFQNWRGHRQ